MNIEEYVEWLYDFEEDLLISEPSSIIIEQYMDTGRIGTRFINNLMEEYGELFNEPVNGIKTKILLVFTMKSLQVKSMIEIDESQVVHLNDKYVDMFQRIKTDDVFKITKRRKKIELGELAQLKEHAIYRMKFNFDDKKYIYFYTFNLSELKRNKTLEIILFDYFDENTDVNFSQYDILQLPFLFIPATATRPALYRRNFLVAVTYSSTQLISKYNIEFTQDYSLSQKQLFSMTKEDGEIDKSLFIIREASFSEWLHKTFLLDKKLSNK